MNIRYFSDALQCGYKCSLETTTFERLSSVTAVMTERQWYSFFFFFFPSGPENELEQGKRGNKIHFVFFNHRCMLFPQTGLHR